jgi:RNA polymerase sigma factor (sigma-70 family)
MTDAMAESQIYDLLSAFQVYYDDLRAFLTRKCGSTMLAAEVVQEMYLRLRRLVAVPPVEEPRAYLFRMADHLAIDHLRAQERHAQRHVELPSEDMPSLAPSPEVIAESRQQVEILRRAVLELPERCREAFLLHKGLGKSYSAIAAELGISVRTVEHHLAKAMSHCRKRLREAAANVQTES